MFFLLKNQTLSIDSIFIGALHQYKKINGNLFLPLKIYNSFQSSSIDMKKTDFKEHEAGWPS